LLWEAGQLIATGSRTGNLLKCIAVDPSHQGEGLLAKVLTALRQEAFREGHCHLFLYTKPANAPLFCDLLFYPVAQTGDVLLMEDRRDGIGQFIRQLAAETHSGKIGAAVMNCDPFTLGHQYLVETAAKTCDHLYVFVLSEDKGHFSASDRMEMVRRGTAHLKNVTVLPTGPYLISSATFPTYFLKNRDQAAEIHCALDVEIFARHFAPAFSITTRFVGTEPLSPLTEQYNEILKAQLPARGIGVEEIPRLTNENTPVSASAVRAALAAGDWQAVQSLVPHTTFAYLKDLGRRI
jgi:[citrate (pro-3S)-lyase] ligase